MKPNKPEPFTNLAYKLINEFIIFIEKNLLQQSLKLKNQENSDFVEFVVADNLVSYHIQLDHRVEPEQVVYEGNLGVDHRA
jgi:hypothetical protein